MSQFKQGAHKGRPYVMSIFVEIVGRIGLEGAMRHIGNSSLRITIRPLAETQT